VYTVAVTDALNNTAEATATILQVNSLIASAGTSRPACQGYCTGISIGQFGGGTAPYSYSSIPPGLTPTPGDVGIEFHGMCPWQNYTITAIDANGCAGSTNVMVGDMPMWMHGVGNITPACGGQANGTITMTEGTDPNFMGFNQYRVYGSSGSYQEYAASPMDLPFVITGLPADTFYVEPWYTDVQSVGYCMAGPSNVIVTSLAEPCGSVSGMVFHDADQDCAFNGADLPLPHRVLTIEPGPTYALTNDQGAYYSAMSFGAFTLAQPLVDEEQLCPSNLPVPFTIDGGTPDVLIDFADSSVVPHDLSVNIWSTPARPGFPTQLWIEVTNRSAYPSGTVDLALTFDPLLQNPVPANPNWNLPSLAPYAHQLFHFQADVPAEINLLGTVLNYVATATNTANEVNTLNNSVSLSTTITGSYDPNDKQGRTSSGIGDPNYYFPIYDEHLGYTIRFQNTGTDTAFTVVVRDTLDADLDISSLQILGASDPFTPSFEQARTLVFTFNNINLPDSAADLLGSQGFISYRIKPRSDIQVGDVLNNTASIYFDLNPPIITNTTAHQVAVTVGVEQAVQPVDELIVFPNPATDELQVIIGDAGVGAHTADVLSMDGRLVMHIGAISSTAKISTASIAAGAYVLRLRDAEGRTQQASFMKR
jgi:uncharacterized repeat protein (TIGR01451 family)